MTNWILVDHTCNKRASGTAMNRLSRALKSAGIDLERKITWTGKLPEKIILAALNTDAVVYNLIHTAVTICAAFHKYGNTIFHKNSNVYHFQ